ncbi:MAG: twin-arginine translocation pathway signal protein [Pseudomonadota bacterium]
MLTRRRTFLKIAGGSTIVLAAAGAGLGTFVATRTPAAALAPWQKAGRDYEDPRLNALSYALLAPNPHNRQPWIVGLEGNDRVTVTADPARRLPATDPFDRQIVIGLGCFLELARMAAAADGYALRIEPFPDGEGGDRLDDRPVARLVFERSSISADPLFAHVLERRTNKEPFDVARTVSGDQLEALERTASPHLRTGGTVDSARIERLRDLTWRAHVKEATTPPAHRESVKLMRIGKAEINANPDGVDLGGPFLEGLALLGVLSRAQLADPQSQAFAQGLDIYREILGSAMGYVWLITSGNSRLDQLDAGRDWVRINLQATSIGIGVHPLSQALQEYPEMVQLKAEMDQEIGVEGDERLQMLARVGYGVPMPPSPRWSLNTRLRS